MGQQQLLLLVLSAIIVGVSIVVGINMFATNAYQANSAYMQMSQMAYNLSISMQHSMGMSTDRDTKGKSTRRFKSMKWKTFRFLILNRAGRIA